MGYKGKRLTAAISILLIMSMLLPTGIAGASGWPSEPTFDADTLYLFQEGDFSYFGSTNDHTFIPAFWFDDSGDLFVAVAAHFQKTPDESKLDLNGKGYKSYTSYGVNSKLLVSSNNYPDFEELASEYVKHGTEHSHWIIINFGQASFEELCEKFQITVDLGAGGHNINQGGIVNIKIAYYTLSLVANPEEGGTVSGGGSYEENDAVTVTAVANGGYKFVNWTDEEGYILSDEATFTYTMPDYDMTLTANFAGISLTKSGPQEARAGDTIEYVFTVKNIGGVNLHDISITDIFFGEDWSYEIGYLAAGASTGEIKISYEIPANQKPGEMSNTATATGKFYRWGGWLNK